MARAVRAGGVERREFVEPAKSHGEAGTVVIIFGSNDSGQLALVGSIIRT
jgi:hypothetical protein